MNITKAKKVIKIVKMYDERTFFRRARNLILMFKLDEKFLPANIIKRKISKKFVIVLKTNQRSSFSVIFMKVFII